MPLVVPGLQSTDGDKTSQWMNKLVGKKIGDTSNETVRKDGKKIPDTGKADSFDRPSRRPTFQNNTASSSQAT